VVVTLAPYELYVGSIVGALRQSKALVDGKKPRFPYKYPGEGFARHCEAACSEQAVAKAFGLYWPPSVNTYTSEPDIPPDIEVRQTHTDRMKVRPQDTGRVVCVTGAAPTFTLCGWLYAKEAQERYPVEDPGNWGAPAHFVPIADLKPIETFAIAACGSSP
jgi:hypothetical protein